MAMKIEENLGFLKEATHFGNAFCDFKSFVVENKLIASVAPSFSHARRFFSSTFMAYLT